MPSAGLSDTLTEFWSAATGTSTVLNPMEVTMSVAAPRTSILKEPSGPALVPALEPLTETEAPETGSLLFPKTLPVMVRVCPWTNATVSRNKGIMRILAIFCIQIVLVEFGLNIIKKC